MAKYEAKYEAEFQEWEKKRKAELEAWKTRLDAKHEIWMAMIKPETPMWQALELCQKLGFWKLDVSENKRLYENMFETTFVNIFRFRKLH